MLVVAAMTRALAFPILALRARFKYVLSAGAGKTTVYSTRRKRQGIRRHHLRQVAKEVRVNPADRRGPSWRNGTRAHLRPGGGRLAAPLPLARRLPVGGR